MARVFVYDGREFPDPDPGMSVDEVRQSMVNFFPELSNAETKTSKQGEDEVHTFQKRVGTKGAQTDPFPWGFYGTIAAIIIGLVIWVFVGC